MRLLIMKLKEDGCDSKEILEQVWNTFPDDDLPDPLRRDLKSDTSPTNYIDKEYSNMKKLLNELDLNPKESLKKSELKRLAMIKRAYSIGKHT